MPELWEKANFKSDYPKQLWLRIWVWVLRKAQIIVNLWEVVKSWGWFCRNLSNICSRMITQPTKPWVRTTWKMAVSSTKVCKGQKQEHLRAQRGGHLRVQKTFDLDIGLVTSQKLINWCWARQSPQTSTQMIDKLWSSLRLLQRSPKKPKHKKSMIKKSKINFLTLIMMAMSQ